MRLLCPDLSMGLRRRYCPHTMHGYSPVRLSRYPAGSG